MSYKECPDCEGKGKYVGFRWVEDPCDTCEGDGQIWVKGDSDSYQDCDEPDTEEMWLFEDEEDDDFVPFSSFIKGVGTYVKRQTNPQVLVRTKNLSCWANIDLRTFFVVDVFPAGSNPNSINTGTCCLHKNLLKNALKKMPFSAKDLFHTQQGRDVFARYMCYRDVRHVPYKFVDAVQEIENILQKKGL